MTVRLMLISVAAILTLAPAFFGQTGAFGAEDQPAVTILAPTSGQEITDGTVAIVPQFRNWAMRCDLAGTRNVPGAGHYHLYLDGALVNMFCGSAVLSFQNVKAGAHTLAILPARNDHEEIESAKAEVKITYRPAVAPAYATALPASLRPSVQILWPRNGSAVSGPSFPLLFDVRNFRLSCDLMGKQKLANTGHWHVDVDKAESGMMMMEQKPGQGGAMMAPHTGPASGGMSGEHMMSMMSMATMLAMGCNNEFDVPLAGISAGKHTFFVVLVDNTHEPLEHGPVASVAVNVRK